MKPCSYCGRESQDIAISCRECGTVFVEPDNLESDDKPAEANESSWIQHTLGYCGVFVAILCFYLLSLGPFMRYFGTTTRLPAATTATIATAVKTMTSATGTTAVVTVTRSYPGWVGIIYYPA